MRILHVTNTFAPARNGVAAVVGMLRRELMARGHDVAVLTGRLAGRAADDGIHELPTMPGFAPEYPLPMALLGAPAELTGTSFDVVHVHHPVLLGPVGARLAKGCGAKTVFTAHSVYTDYLDSYFAGIGRPMKAGVARRTARFLSGFDLVLAPSTHVAETMRAWGVTARIEMLEAAADVTPMPKAYARRRLGIEEQTRLVLDVGRLAPEKRHDVTLREFARALKRVPEARLVVVGDGGLQKALVRQAASLDIADRVLILPGLSREELTAWYAAADVLVAASLSETGPLTVVEAMTCGTPAVSYDAPGFRDRIVSGENGFLVAPDDGELGCCLARVLEDERLRLDLAAAALQRAGRYTPERVTETLLGYYVELLSSKESS